MKLKIIIVFFLSFLSPLAFSDYYKRGNYHCDSFKRMKQLYKRYPHNVDAQMGYARCLILQEKDNEGLSLLHNIVSRHNHVKTIFTLAEYIGTGGTFEDKVDKKNINQAIDTYQRVLLFINGDLSYPNNGNVRYEQERQMELTSIYRVPLLYYNKFMYGADGSDNRYLLRSPSYKGDRDLNTYPQYSPYTIDSLKKTIQFANRCLALPKKRHFRSNYYKDYREACQILKNGAIALLPLEQKRLTLLTVTSCSGDLPQCSEYAEIKNKIISIIQQTTSAINTIFNYSSTTASTSQ